MKQIWLLVIALFCLVLGFVVSLPKYSLETIVKSVDYATANDLPSHIAKIAPLDMCVMENGDIIFRESSLVVKRMYSNNRTVSIYMGKGSSINDDVDVSMVDFSSSNNRVKMIVKTPQGECAVLETLRIRIISNVDNTVKTIAGNLTSSVLGDGELATYAKLQSIVCFAIDEYRNLYTCESSRIRKVTNTTNIISTIGGTGTSASTIPPDGQNAATNNIKTPTSIIARQGVVYFTTVNSIMMIKNGLYYTISGSWSTCTYNVTYDGPAKTACLSSPKLVDMIEDELYFTDKSDTIIRKISKDGYVYLIAGSGTTSIDVTRSDQALQNVALNIKGIALKQKDSYIEYYLSLGNNLVKVSQNNLIQVMAGKLGKVDFSLSAYQYGLQYTPTSKIIKGFKNGDFLLVAENKQSLYRFTIKTGILSFLTQTDLPIHDLVLDKSTWTDVYIVTTQPQNYFFFYKFSLSSKSMEILAGNFTGINFQYDGQDALNTTIISVGHTRFFNQSLYFNDKKNFRILELNLKTKTLRNVIGIGSQQGYTVSGLRTNITCVDFVNLRSILINPVSGHMVLRNNFLITYLDNNNVIQPLIGKNGDDSYNSVFPMLAENVKVGTSTNAPMIYHPNNNTLLFIYYDNNVRETFLLEYLNDGYVRTVFKLSNLPTVKSIAVRKATNRVYYPISGIVEYNPNTNIHTPILTDLNIKLLCLMSDDNTIAYSKDNVVIKYNLNTQTSTSISGFSTNIVVLYCHKNNEIYVVDAALSGNTQITNVYKISSNNMVEKVIGYPDIDFYGAGGLVVTNSGDIYLTSYDLLYKFNSSKFIVVGGQAENTPIQAQAISSWTWSISNEGDIYFMQYANTNPMKKASKSTGLVTNVIGNGTIDKPTSFTTSTNYVTDFTKDGSYFLDFGYAFNNPPGALYYSSFEDKYYFANGMSFPFGTSSFTKDDDILFPSTSGISRWTVDCERDRFGFCLQTSPFCFGIFYNNETVCSGKGNCMDYNVCECYDNYLSIDCSITSCFGVLSNDSLVCSGYGKCSAFDTCECLKGYFGENCTNFMNSTSNSTIIDFNNTTLVDNSTIISNSSTWNNTINLNSTEITNSTLLDNCTINLNCTNLPNNTYITNTTTVDNSTIISNSSIYNNNTNFSNSTSNSTIIDFNNTTLVDNSTVISNSSILNNTINDLNNSTNYFNSTNMNNTTNSSSIILCYGIMSNDSKVCSNNGLCISENFCKCNSSYYGSICQYKTNETKSCFGYDHSNPLVCSRAGICAMNDTCICVNGYFGSRCFTKISSFPNFNSFGNTIEFHLTTFYALEDSVIDCWKVISNNDLLLFGEKPLCFWKNGNFFIELGKQFSLKPYMNISINVNAFDNSITNESLSLFTIMPSTNPVKPIINASYKKVISSCEEILIDASGSYCEDMKPLKFLFSIESSPDPKLTLDAITFNNLNSSVQVKSNITGVYVFSLIVESSFSGAKSNKQLIEITKSTIPSPTISILNNKLALLNIKKSEIPLVIKKVIELPSCYFENKEFYYIWKKTSGPDIGYKIDFNNDLLITDISTDGNQVYTFSVTAISKVNSESNSTTFVSISTKTQDLQLNIFISSLTTTEAKIAIEYFDPDKVASMDVWSWSCLDRVVNQPCQDSVIVTQLIKCSTSKSTLCIVQKTTLSKITLTLSVHKGNRSVIESIDLEFPNIKSEIPPIISLISVYPKRVKLLKDETLSLQLSVILGGEEKYTNTDYMIREWTINGEKISKAMTSKMHIDLLESSSLILSVSELNEEVDYIISLKVTDTRNNLSSKYSHKFKVVKSPKSCDCFVNPSSGYALETSFSFSCPGCQNVEKSIDFVFGFIDDKSGVKIPLYNLGEKFSTYFPSSYYGKELTAFVDIVDVDTGAYVGYVKSVEIKAPIVTNIEQIKAKVETWQNYASSLSANDNAKSVFNSATISRTIEIMISKLNLKRSEIWLLESDIIYSLRENIIDSMILALKQRNSLEPLSETHFRVFAFGLESISVNSPTFYSLPFEKLLNLTEKLTSMAHQNDNFILTKGVDYLCNNLFNNIIRLLKTTTKGGNSRKYNNQIVNVLKKFNSIVLRNYFVGQKDYIVELSYFSVSSMLSYKNQQLKKTITYDKNNTLAFDNFGVDISNRVVLATSVFSTEDFMGISDVLNKTSSIQFSLSNTKEQVKSITYKLLSKIILIDKEYTSDLKFTFYLKNYNFSNINTESTVQMHETLEKKTVDSKTLVVSNLECVPVDNLFFGGVENCSLVVSSPILMCNCSSSVTAVVVVEKTLSNTVISTTPIETTPSVNLYGLFGLFGLIFVCLGCLLVASFIVLCALLLKKRSRPAVKEEIELPQIV